MQLVIVAELGQPCNHNVCVFDILPAQLVYFLDNLDGALNGFQEKVEI